MDLRYLHLAVLIGTGVLCSVSCSSTRKGVRNLREKVREGEIKVDQARQMYESYKEEYIERRKFAKKLISLYYGESREFREDEEGVQDIVGKKLNEFPEERREQLKGADRKVDQLVESLEQLDTRLVKLDHRVQEGIEDAEEFLRQVREFLKAIENFNARTEAVTEVLKKGLKIGSNIGKEYITK